MKLKIKKTIASVVSVLIVLSQMSFAASPDLGENSSSNYNPNHSLNNIKDNPLKDIEADNSKGRGEIEFERAQNGTPIVQINRPSTGGVSVNYYKDFNVNRENLILNNYKGEAINTNLAGAVYGNPNFNKEGGREADIILNEVTSVKQTKIDGYVEIAGKKADLIIANPNGIMISGGGFINTARLTLINGVSGMGDLNKTLDEAGGLNPFMLSKDANAAITVVGKNVVDKDGSVIAYNLGIDAKNINYAQLIGRIIKINGDIIGGGDTEIEVISGNDKAVYNKEAKRFEVTSADGEVSEVKPEFAIDSTAFGGIYAGKIRIIATEDGVGVRMRKDLISDVDDIEFDVNGNLLFEEMSASGKSGVRIKTKDSFENKGEIESAEGSISINAGKDIDNKGLIYAKEVDFKSGASVNNAAGAEIIAGNAYFESEKINNEGEIYAYENIDMDASGQITNAQSAVIGAENIYINTDAQINTDGKIYAESGLDIKAEKEINNAGEIAGTNLYASVSDGGIKNYGTIYAVEDAEIFASKNLNNYEPGQIGAAANISIKTGESIINEGKIYADETLALETVKSIENMQKGILESGGINAKAGGKIINYGSIYAYCDNVMSLLKSAEEINNDGNIYAKEGLTFEADKAISNAAAGVIEAGSLYVMSQQSITNAGNIFALGDMTVNSSASIFNAASGIINSQNVYFASLGPITNYGNIFAINELSIIAQKAIINGAAAGSDAIIAAGNLVYLKSDEKIINYGYMQAEGSTDENGDKTEGSGKLVLETTAQINDDYKLNDIDEEIDENIVMPQTPADVLAKIANIQNINDIDELYSLLLQVQDEESYYKVSKRIRELDVEELIENMKNGYAYSEDFFKLGEEIEGSFDGETVTTIIIDEEFVQNMLKGIFGGKYDAAEWIMPEIKIEDIVLDPQDIADIAAQTQTYKQAIIEQEMENQGVTDPLLIVLTPAQLDDIANYEENLTLDRKEEIRLEQMDVCETERLAKIEDKMTAEQDRIESFKNVDWLNIDEAAFSQKMQELLTQGYMGETNYNEIDWKIYEFSIGGIKPFSEIQKYLLQLRIDNKDDISVEKTGIHNYGRLFANEEVQLNSKSVVHNNEGALIYSKGDINFNVKETVFNNTGGNGDGTGIYAQRDINIGGDHEYANSLLGKLINYNGHIEAERNINMKAEEAINYGSDDANIFWDPYLGVGGVKRIYYDTVKNTAPFVPPSYTHFLSPGYNEYLKLVYFLKHTDIKVAEDMYDSILTSQESKIIARGTANIDATRAIVNYNSTIYGGENLKLQADTVINTVGEFEVTFTQYYKQLRVFVEGKFGMFSHNPDDGDKNLLKALEYLHGGYWYEGNFINPDMNMGAGYGFWVSEIDLPNEYGVILKSDAKARLMSSGTVEITANKIFNGSISDTEGEASEDKKSKMITYEELPSSSFNLNGKNAASIEGGKYEPSYIGNGAVIDVLKNFELPASKYGKYRPSADPSYLYETDPLLRDITTFLGSQYFLNRIGLDPFSIEEKFLGDRFLEYDILRRSLEQQGFIENLNFSDAELEEYISSTYETLDAEKVKDLGLEFGKELTEEQINALEEDIVWYVLKEVELPNGEIVKVLVPQIYLCQETVNRLKMPQRAVREVQENISLKQAEEIGRARADGEGKAAIQKELDRIQSEAEKEAQQRIKKDLEEFIKNNPEEYDKLITEELNGMAAYYDLGESFVNNVRPYSKKSEALLESIAQERVKETLLKGLKEEREEAYIKAIIEEQENALDKESIYQIAYGKVYDKYYEEELARAKERNIVEINTDSMISGKEVVITSLDGSGGVLNNSGVINGERTVVVTMESINNATKYIGGKQAAITAGDLIYLDAGDFGTINNESAMIMTRNEGSVIDIKAGEFNNVTDSRADKYESNNFKETKTAIGAAGQVSSAGSLKINATGDINLKGSALTAKDDVTLKAGGDIKASVTEDYYYRYEKTKKDGGWFSDTKTKITETEKLTNIGSFITSGGITQMDGTNLNLQYTNIEGQDGVNLTAKENVNLTTALNTTYSYSSVTKENTFIGSEADAVMNAQGTNQGTSIKSGSDINIISGKDINAISANIRGAGDINLSADGNINLFVMQDYSKSYEMHKKTDGLLQALGTWDGLMNVLNPLRGFADGIEQGFQTMLNPLDNVDINISWEGISASVSYKEEIDKVNTENNTAKVNEITSGGNITLQTDGNILSTGTQMSAANDINIEGTNILLLSAQNSSKSKIEHEDKTVTIGVKVGNAYVDAGLAAKALYDAEQALEQATYDLREMEKLYKSGKASKDAVEDAQLNLTMATANVANATIALAASIAGAATAASSSYGTGMYAAGFANYESNKLSITTEELYATQSNLFAQGNINFTSTNDMTQEGTNVYATKGTLTYDIGNDLLIQASKNTFSQERKTENISGGVSVGNNAVQVSAGYGQSSDRMKATTYINSESIAQDIIMNVGNNATLSGANVYAINDLTVDVGNNLIVESLQDTYYAKGNSWSVNASIGIGTNDMGSVFGTGDPKNSNAGNNSVGLGFNVGNSYTDSAWVNQQTSLTSGNSANITVGNKTTLTGAIIGSESGDMTLTTKELEYNDLKDKNVSRETGFGFSTSVGLGKGTDAVNADKQKTSLAPGGSTTLSFKNTGSDQRQTTYATIGEGNIIIAGQAATTEQLTGLNRDLSNTQTITKDQIIGALDASVTIDNRVLLGFLKKEVKDEDGNTIYEQNPDGTYKIDEDGRGVAVTISGYQSIANDFTNFMPNLAKATLGAAGTIIATGKTIFDVATNSEIGIGETAEAWKANQKTFVNQNNYDRGTINNLSEGKSAEEIEAGAGGTVRVYYNAEDKDIGFRQKGDEDVNNNYLNAALGAATDTRVFVTGSAHEYSHNYTSNETIAANAGKLAGFMWGLGNVLNLTSINTSGNATSSSWYASNQNSSLLQNNTSIANSISQDERMTFHKETMAFALGAALSLYGNNEAAGTNKEELSNFAIAGSAIGGFFGTNQEAADKINDDVKQAVRGGEEYQKLSNAVDNVIYGILNNPMETLSAIGGMPLTILDALNRNPLEVLLLTEGYAYAKSEYEQGYYLTAGVALLGSLAIDSPIGTGVKQVGKEVVETVVRKTITETAAETATKKTADNVLVYGSEKGFTTIGESASIGKTGIVLNDLKAAQLGADNFWTNFSEKTWTGYTTYYPTGTLDNYMTILNTQSPWPLGYNATAHSIQLTSADTFNMVLNKGQPFPGTFGVKENITSITQARNDLALKVAWKPEPATVVTYRPKENVILEALYGPIGSQIDLPANKFLPGNPNMTQYELLFPKGILPEQRINFIEEVPESLRNLK
ncbi:MAG: hemagglutinin repeat-containing protein [Endomicrobia bacterium]|nr:hemagglutinin repeat-containing protein [Endomicrobiia bacterium]